MKPLQTFIAVALALCLCGLGCKKSGDEPPQQGRFVVLNSISDHNGNLNPNMHNVVVKEYNDKEEFIRQYSLPDIPKDSRSEICTADERCEHIEVHFEFRPKEGGCNCEPFVSRHLNYLHKSLVKVLTVRDAARWTSSCQFGAGN